MKPEPPLDLWERMDAIVAKEIVTRPPNSFTAREYMDKYKVHWDRAKRELERLVLKGKVTRTKIGRNVYYTLV